MTKQLLFLPGPVTVPEPVLAAMAKPMIDHRGPAFAELLHAVDAGLRPIFGTQQQVLVLGASGTGGLEAAVGNCFGPGDTLLACPIGVFGRRLIGIAEAFGATVEVLETEWGYGVDPRALAQRLRADDAGRITGILLTHNETSTGVQNDMAALAEAIAGHPALVVVDSVSGMGASPFAMDAWGFDVVVTASQKALAVPPGLAMVAASPRAWERMARTATHRYYFDLRKAREFAQLGQTPWTPPVSILYALDAALELFERETPEGVHARHALYAHAIRTSLGALGLELFSHAPHHSVTVVAARVPAGLDAAALLRSLRESQGLVLSGGQGTLKGSIIRIGTMGDLTRSDILGMLGSLEIALLEHGHRLELGTGVRAALGAFTRAEAGSHAMSA